MNKFIVALTGGIGSGKSSVAERFAELGVTIVDSDAIAHQLTAAGGAALPALKEAFGADIVDAQGALDRARMRKRVFEDAAARRELESILHPMIGAEARRRCDEATGEYVIRMIPLLVEGGDPHRRFARVLVVDCSEETQIARTMARSGMSRAEVEKIMATQATRTERLAHADDVIDNDGPTDALGAKVEALHRQYLRLAAAT